MATLNFTSIDSGSIDSGSLKLVGFTGIASGDEVTIELSELLYVIQAYTDPKYTSLSHASRHILNGDDAIDGDRLGIDFSPTNYSPGTTPAEVSDVDHLTSHLYGIDVLLGSLGSTLGTATGDIASLDTILTQVTGDIADIINSGVAAHASSHIQGTGDEIDGDKLDIDFTPTNYAPSTDPAEVDDLDQLSAHLKGIDVLLGSLGSTLATATGNISTNATNITNLSNSVSANAGNISIIGALASGLETGVNITGSGLVQGGGTLENDITLTVLVASAAEVRATDEANKAVTPANLANYFVPQNLSSGSPIAWDVDGGVNARLELSWNGTLGSMSNVKAGQCGNLEVVQSGAGGNTLSFTGTYLFPAGEAPTLSTGVGDVDLFSWYSPNGTQVYINILNGLA